MHIMIDIETLGKAPDGCLIQLGWATFDFEKVYESGGFTIAAVDSQSRGMTIDADTVVNFWMNQPEDLRKHVFKGEYTLSRALSSFAMAHKWENFEGVWTNAPLFDFVILRNAYKRIGGTDKIVERVPWSYRQERCSRTLMQIAKYRADKLGINFNLPPRHGTQHDAVADAIYQAEVVVYLMGVING